jgi:tripartite-type tricarboxylate transporter receptor subunit TctC
MKKNFLSMVLCFVASLLLVSFSTVEAAEYPERPITMIIQFGAGSTTDILHRKLADEASKILGQPIVCVNKAGGGGTIGIGEVVRAKPDGYTIGVANLPALAIMPNMQPVPYDPLKDINHICGTSPYEYGLYVKPDSPWKTFQEFIEYFKARPGELIYGSTGVGTSNHLIMLRIAKENGIKMKHVVFKGDSELVAAILGGHIHAAVSGPALLVPQAKANQVRILIVTSKNRWPYMPELPTLMEAGYKFYQFSNMSLIAPPKTPEPIRAKLESAFRQVLERPEFKKEMSEKYFLATEYLNGAEYGKMVQEQYDFYKVFLKEEGISN